MSPTAARKLADVDDDELVEIALKGLRDSTAGQQEKALRTYAHFCKCRTIGAALRQLIKRQPKDAWNHVESFADSREDIGRSVVTVDYQVRAVRSAVRQLHHEGFVPWDLDPPRRLHAVTKRAAHGGKPITPIGLAAFEEEIRPLYRPPLRGIDVARKMAKVFAVLLSTPGMRTTADLTAVKIEAMVNACNGSETERRDLIKGLHRICSLAVERHRLEINPLSGKVPPPKRTGFRVAIVLHPSEVERLLEHLRTKADSWSKHRLYALVATAIALDVSTNEALHLRPSDVDLVHSTITMNTGRRAPVQFKIPEWLHKILAEWLPVAGDHWLFPGRNRVSRWTSGLPRHGVSGHIRQAGQAVGIPSLTFESLRLFGSDRISTPALIRPGRGKNVWVITGREMAPLTRKPHIRVIQKAYEAWTENRRLSLTEIGDDRKAFKEVKGLHPLWEAIVDMPETEGNRGRGYGFRDPRISI